MSTADRDRLTSLECLAPGLYVEPDGTVRFETAEILRGAGRPDTPDNRAAIANELKRQWTDRFPGVPIEEL